MKQLLTEKKKALAELMANYVIITCIQKSLSGNYYISVEELRNVFEPTLETVPMTDDEILENVQEQLCYHDDMVAEAEIEETCISVYCYGWLDNTWLED